MREMKDSGIAWIGAIPNHWRVSKIKQIVRWKSVKGQPDLPVLSLYRDYGVIPKDSRDDNHNVTSLDTSGYKVVEHGDLVINKMKAWQGSLAVSEYNGIVSPAYHICKITSENICKKYLHYLLRDASYLPEYMRLSTGLRVGQWDLSFDDFKNIPFLVPSLAEQERIAAFLDAECAEIDAVLEKTRASIEEYKKLKQAVITQAVTKGIFDKQIYPHNVKLKYLLYIASGDAIRNEELSEVGKYPAYGGGESLGFASKYNTLENSLIVGRVGARCGCVTYIDSKAWATDNALIVHPICNPRYMYYMLIYSQLNNLNTSNAQPLITATKIKNVVVPYFLEDICQKKIVDFLDEKCACIDAIIEKKQQYLIEIETYKKSLIYEYVTGKKEVV